MVNRDEPIAGKYRLEQCVGSGAMGVVFRARDPMDRMVAVKFIADAHAHDAGYRERFRREVETSAVAKHPHILDLYDAGELPDGELYLVMRYMPDGDLARYVAAHGPLAPRDAARLVLHAADALEHLHRADIVHRDVKPHNLLFERIGETLHAYLSDFGIVKKSDETPLTSTGSAMHGTRPYAAPEQLAGESVDRRADVYAAGQTLRYLVSRSANGHDGYETAIDRKLRRIIKRATRQQPSRRYQTAGELAAALRNYLGLPDPDIEARANPSRPHGLAHVAVVLMVVAAAPLGFTVMRHDLLPDSSATRFGVVEIPRSAAWHRVRSAGFGVAASTSRLVLATRPGDGEAGTLTIGTTPASARAVLAEMSAAVHHLPTVRVGVVGPHDVNVTEGRLRDGRAYVINAVPTSRGYVVLACLSGTRGSPRFLVTCRREVASIGIAEGGPRAARPSKSFVSALRADWSLGASARQHESAALTAGTLPDRARAASAISNSYRRGASDLLAEARTLIDASLARHVSDSMTATATAFASLASASRRHDRHAYSRARTLIHRLDHAAGTLVASLKRSGIKVILRAG